MFEWLRSKRKVVEDNRKMFFGHDLNEWNYLGRTTLSLTLDGKGASSSDVFFFCAKGDMDDRSYYIVKESLYEKHSWITGLAEPWRAGFKDVYLPIKDDPSPFLKQYMLEKYRAKWNEDDKWWKITDDSKYEAAKKEQEEKKEVDNSEEKVVKFPKKTS